MQNTTRPPSLSMIRLDMQKIEDQFAKISRKESRQGFVLRWQDVAERGGMHHSSLSRSLRQVRDGEEITLRRTIQIATGLSLRDWRKLEADSPATAKAEPK